MCGICGVINKSSHLKGDAINGMIEAIKHRGPDYQDHLQLRNVTLGHARLSILDLSDAGRQPMRTIDGRYTIVYNGEVYNFRELIQKHHIENLNSHCDTEVILRLFEKTGINSVSELNGMFAFAVYDSKEELVWLIRDRFGVKPLYYSQNDDEILFGSEIASITGALAKKTVCNKSAMHEWLYYGNNLGKRTLISGIQKLLPGHYLKINCKNLTIQDGAYWQPGYTAMRGRWSEYGNNHFEITRNLIERSVKRQLVSDVPIGIYLSGGIDSGVITAFASKNYNGKIATYTAAFDYDKYGDELAFAKETARKFGTEHHEIKISGYDVSDTVEKLIAHHGIPFSDAANIPLFLLSNIVKESRKVILQGDGGDELFCGYKRYSTLYYLAFLKYAARAGLLLNKLGGDLCANHRLLRYLRILSEEKKEIVFAKMMTEEDVVDGPEKIFTDDYIAAINGDDPFERYRECYKNVVTRDTVNQMSFIDQEIILPDIFFEKVDRATMSAGIEARVPFIDNDILDFCRSLSGNEKAPLGQKKWLLKKSMEHILPEKIIKGKKKGFGVPYGYWLKTSLKPMFNDYLERFSRNSPGVLNSGVVSQMYRMHESGRRDRSFLLWKVLNLMIWADRFKITFE